MSPSGAGSERIGCLIRQRRLHLGLTEEDVAQRLITASGRPTVTRSDVWRWEVEYENRMPGPQWLPYLAEVLELPEDALRRAKAVSRAARRFRVTAPVAAEDVIASLLPPDTELAPSGTTAGRAVGVADAEALIRRIHGLRLADDVLAGGDLVETAVRELRSAVALHNNQIDSADQDDPSAADEPRQWLYWVDRGEQEVMQARVYTQLHRPLRAVPLLRKVLGTYDASHAREYALYSSWLAVALADANEPEEAAATARRMFEVLAGVPSSRAQDRSKAVISALQRHREVPEAAEVLAEWA